MNRRFFLLAGGGFAASIAFSSCTASQPAASGSSADSSPASVSASPVASDAVLKVAVTPVPAGEILAFVRDNLAPQAGLKAEVVEFNDFNQPNLALQDGSVDANYYQHIPFMTNFAKNRNLDLVALNAVHFNPVGAFSKKIKSLNQLSNSAVITIPNDATNGNRALRLLADEKLVSLRDGVGELATVKDIIDNPKNLQIKEIEAPSLIRSLDDAEVSIITGNFVVQAGMNTKRDAIVLEKAEGTQYAVHLATLRGKENDPRIQTLNKLLVDPKVREFINQKYEGAVIPVF
ncbi:NLPA lipoprotein [Phormidium tenue FACHB-886]|nr:NLPA lipoprotein [Phormidium tenue FACHB-886]